MLAFDSNSVQYHSLFACLVGEKNVWKKFAKSQVKLKKNIIQTWEKAKWYGGMVRARWRSLALLFICVLLSLIFWSDYRTTFLSYTVPYIHNTNISYIFFVQKLTWAFLLLFILYAPPMCATCKIYGPSPKNGE